MSGKLLIVEDEFLIAQDIRRIVTKLGYGVIGISKSASEAVDLVKSESPDIALLDINILGDLNGIELSKILTEQYQVPFLFVTSYSDTKTLKAMNATNPLGYILKPFDHRDIRVALEIAFTKIRQEPRPRPGAVNGAATKGDFTIVGDSPKLQEILDKVRKVAPTDVTVLVQGETGAGKELIMEAIHKSSTREKKPLIKVNCAALPENLIESVLFGHEKGSFTGATEKKIGKFEQANGGTIFLDEVGELPLASQSKLLRCLQEKEIEIIGGVGSKKIDVRVIAATNRDLADEVNKGNFRADLFFRLNIFPITVYPLRERKEDIIILANHFLQFYGEKFNKPNLYYSKTTQKKLQSYCWPGNIRELKHYVERSIILSDSEEVEVFIEATETEAAVTQENDFMLKSLEDIEREQIIQTLNYCNGKVRGVGGAAEILKLHPNTLDFKIKKLGIKKEKHYSKKN